MKLFPVKIESGFALEPLDLIVVVDGSVIEVFANDRTVVTTRRCVVYRNIQTTELTRLLLNNSYPWLTASTGCGFVIEGSHTDVTATDVEVWDGLSAPSTSSLPFSSLMCFAVNAWPDRPADTRKPLLYDGPALALWNLWAGV